MIGKGFTWECGVDGCEAKGTLRPRPYFKARRGGIKHMLEFHPGVDPNTVIVKEAP